MMISFDEFVNVKSVVVDMARLKGNVLMRSKLLKILLYIYMVLGFIIVVTFFGCSVYFL